MAVIGTAAVVGGASYLIHKNISKKKAEDVECTVELLLRIAANDGKSAKDVYNQLYRKDPIKGKSGLSYCESKI